MDLYEQKSFDERVDVLYLINRGYTLLLEVDSVFVGILMAYELPDILDGATIYRELLSVSTKFQRRGYGTMLINELEKMAKDMGITAVSLQTACYRPAYHFYQKLGYIDMKVDQRYMTKSLLE